MKITKISTKFYVYVHTNPSNGKVFYVGKGSSNRAYQTRSRNDHWKNTVNKYGINVSIVKDNMTNEEAASFEMWLISFYGMENLCNMTAGGEGCISLKQESKDKISNSLKGKTQSFESNQKRIASLKKTWANPELRELKRIQSIELYRLGIICKKGIPSKKKGLPFDGDKVKLSESLKKYYSINNIWNKIIPDSNQIQFILESYKKNKNVLRISKSINRSRNFVYRILKENGYITTSPKEIRSSISI